MTCRKTFIFFLLFFFCFQGMAAGEKTKDDQSLPVVKKDQDKGDISVKMLHSIIELRKNISQRISEKKRFLKKSHSDTEKEQLKSELEKLDKQLNDASVDFERIATGIDIGLFIEKKEKFFNWKNELLSLVEPGIKEIKRLTVKARYKAKLKDEVVYYENLVPIAGAATKNINGLIAKVKDRALKKHLKTLLPEWNGVEKQIRNKLEIAGMQLTEIEDEETSLIEATQKSIKNFFRTRGLFLFVAVFACLGVVLFLRMSSKFIIRNVPGYKEKYRPFHIRMLELLSKTFALVMTLFVLVFVFYIFGDWVLLSLTIIFFIGIGWAAKHTLPKFWHQSRMMLNIGPVREGERIMYNGVPWLVKNINVFTTLENPYMEITLRLPIDKLLDKTSRPYNKDEPWFPCKKNDWVILADQTRGHVTSLSHEMVELVQRGGAKKTYQTSQFLALSPLNLSVNFRLKVPFGISYDIQKESTDIVPEKLSSYLMERIKLEGYEKSLLNIRVEFMQAGASSLDLVVIADFKGETAHLYQRLTRSIQRWCVDACTINNWEIPFPQLTIHK